MTLNSVGLSLNSVEKQPFSVFSSLVGRLCWRFPPAVAATTTRPGNLFFMPRLSLPSGGFGSGSTTGYYEL